MTNKAVIEIKNIICNMCGWKCVRDLTGCEDIKKVDKVLSDLIEMDKAMEDDRK